MQKKTTTQPADQEKNAKPGRGQKKCQRCGKITGPRTRVCECGEAFPSRIPSQGNVQKTPSVVPIDETFDLIDRIRSLRKKLSDEEIINFAGVLEKTGIDGLRQILNKLNQWE